MHQFGGRSDAHGVAAEAALDLAHHFVAPKNLISAFCFQLDEAITGLQGTLFQEIVYAVLDKRA